MAVEANAIKYLTIFKVISYLKIIRIAKVIETSKRIKLTVHKNNEDKSRIKNNFKSKLFSKKKLNINNKNFNNYNSLIAKYSKDLNKFKLINEKNLNIKTIKRKKSTITIKTELNKSKLKKEKSLLVKLNRSKSFFNNNNCFLKSDTKSDDIKNQINLSQDTNMLCLHNIRKKVIASYNILPKKDNQTTFKFKTLSNNYNSEEESKLNKNSILNDTLILSLTDNNNNKANPYNKNRVNNFTNSSIYKLNLKNYNTKIINNNKDASSILYDSFKNEISINKKNRHIKGKSFIDTINFKISEIKGINIQYKKIKKKKSLFNNYEFKNIYNSLSINSHIKDSKFDKTKNKDRLNKSNFYKNLINKKNVIDNKTSNNNYDNHNYNIDSNIKILDKNKSFHRSLNLASQSKFNTVNNNSTYTNINNKNCEIINNNQLLISTNKKRSSHFVDIKNLKMIIPEESEDNQSNDALNCSRSSKNQDISNSKLYLKNNNYKKLSYNNVNSSCINSCIKINKKIRKSNSHGCILNLNISKLVNNLLVLQNINNNVFSSKLNNLSIDSSIKNIRLDKMNYKELNNITNTDNLSLSKEIINNNSKIKYSSLKSDDKSFTKNLRNILDNKKNKEYSIDTKDIKNNISNNYINKLNNTLKSIKFIDEFYKNIHSSCTNIIKLNNSFFMENETINYIKNIVNNESLKNNSKFKSCKNNVKNKYYIKPCIINRCNSYKKPKFNNKNFKISLTNIRNKSSCNISSKLKLKLVNEYILRNSHRLFNKSEKGIDVYKSRSKSVFTKFETQKKKSLNFEPYIFKSINNNFNNFNNYNTNNEYKCSDKANNLHIKDIKTMSLKNESIDYNPLSIESRANLLSENAISSFNNITNFDILNNNDSLIKNVSNSCLFRPFSTNKSNSYETNNSNESSINYEDLFKDYVEDINKSNKLDINNKINKYINKKTTNNKNNAKKNYTKNKDKEKKLVIESELHSIITFKIVMLILAIIVFFQSTQANLVENLLYDEYTNKVSHCISLFTDNVIKAYNYELLNMKSNIYIKSLNKTMNLCFNNLKKLNINNNKHSDNNQNLNIFYKNNDNSDFNDNFDFVYFNITNFYEYNKLKDKYYNTITLPKVTVNNRYLYKSSTLNLDYVYKYRIINNNNKHKSIENLHKTNKYSIQLIDMKLSYLEYTYYIRTISFYDKFFNVLKSVFVTMTLVFVSYQLLKDIKIHLILTIIKTINKFRYFFHLDTINICNNFSNNEKEEDEMYLNKHLYLYSFYLDMSVGKRILNLITEENSNQLFYEQINKKNKICRNTNKNKTNLNNNLELQILDKKLKCNLDYLNKNFGLLSYNFKKNGILIDCTNCLLIIKDSNNVLYDKHFNANIELLNIINNLYLLYHSIVVLYCGELINKNHSIFVNKNFSFELDHKLYCRRISKNIIV